PVAAAPDWGAPMEVMAVRPSHAESYERLFHEAGVPALLLSLGAAARREIREELRPPRLERAIGVVYRPETELQSHYFQAVLPVQFDEYVWFDETRAIRALPAPAREGGPDTYPFGVGLSPCPSRRSRPSRPGCPGCARRASGPTGGAISGPTRSVWCCWCHCGRSATTIACCANANGSWPRSRGCWGGRAESGSAKSPTGMASTSTTWPCGSSRSTGWEPSTPAIVRRRSRWCAALTPPSSFPGPALSGGCART